jgi:FixJ family two-component response regulator
VALAREAMQKGAFDFISKPFKPNDLRRVIMRAAEEAGLPLDYQLEDKGQG